MEVRLRIACTLNCVLCFILMLPSGLKSITKQPVVETSYGKIQGKILKTTQTPQLEFYAFRGIPYAKPPLQNLRFQPPLKPDPWTGTKNCEDYGNSCPQISRKNGSVLGNEDCLTLNIFTNSLKVSKLRPVMFWIHEGAHSKGSAAEFGPDFFMEKPIVLVSLNFRLNVFGFLSVNDKHAYGNIAIKDQIAGLEWVQENIARFGGDPFRVTIFGESSGANSVCLLQLSSRSKGLFHQIIAQSGSALNPRYLQQEPLKYVYNIANYFNISNQTTKEIVEGLQKIDWKELTKAANSSEVTGYTTDLSAMPFYPIVEVENSNAIITQSPYELFETGNFNKIPFILGYNTNEGSLGLRIVNSEMKIEHFDKNYELFAPHSLHKYKDIESIGKTVRDLYLGNASAKCIPKFTRFLGQELIVRGLRKQLDFEKKYSRGYFYRFSYKGTHTIEYEGVGHEEEVQYLFPLDGTGNNLTETDLITRRRMIEMWTNFATFGSPTPNRNSLITVNWQMCNSTTPIHFLDIGENLESGVNPDNEDYELWKKLFKDYENILFQTY